MDTRKTHIAIDHNKCPPCPDMVCLGVCPQGILEPADDNKPHVTNVSSCTKCGVCADLCPEKAITITKNNCEQTNK
ncbi:MAG: 4Fe-4S binding protein [Candidatus Bathyarchaeota archaeon]|nr:4Fe-4S binding protein [Candidatus Bathyarchaeota archaeon]